MTLNLVKRSQAMKELQNASNHVSLPPETELISHLTNKYLEATQEGPDVRNTQCFCDSPITHHASSRKLPFNPSTVEADQCQQDIHISRMTSSKQTNQ